MENYKDSSAPPAYDEIIGDTIFPYIKRPPEESSTQPQDRLQSTSHSAEQITSHLSQFRLQPSPLDHYHQLATGTLLPYTNFDFKNDCDRIRYSFKTKDKDLLLSILCHRSADQRHKISQCYNVSYPNTLAKDVKYAFDFDTQFYNLMLGLVLPMHEYLTHLIRYDIKDAFWLHKFELCLSNLVRYDMYTTFKRREYIQFVILSPNKYK